jgi:hypothetical protein
MQYRKITTAAGDSFDVPEYIVRFDGESLTGWQLRYGEWTDYEDRPGGKGGVEKALQSAICEMTSRIEYKGK